MARANNTMAELQAAVIKLKADVRQLDARLKVIESQPQEQLIQQVGSIHREVCTSLPVLSVFHIEEEKGEVACPPPSLPPRDLVHVNINIHVVGCDTKRGMPNTTVTRFAIILFVQVD